MTATLSRQKNVGTETQETVEPFQPVLFNSARNKDITYLIPGTGGTGKFDPMTRREIIDEYQRETAKFTDGVAVARTPAQLARLRQAAADGDGVYEAKPDYAQICPGCNRLWNHEMAFTDCVKSHGQFLTVTPM